MGIDGVSRDVVRSYVAVSSLLRPIARGFPLTSRYTAPAVSTPLEGTSEAAAAGVQGIDKDGSEGIHPSRRIIQQA